MTPNHLPLVGRSESEAIRVGAVRAALPTRKILRSASNFVGLPTRGRRLVCVFPIQTCNRLVEFRHRLVDDLFHRLYAVDAARDLA